MFLSPKERSMKDFKLIDRIQTAVAVIDKNMTVVDSNNAFKHRNNIKSLNLSPLKCFTAAYNFNESCNIKTEGSCPVMESFKTKKPSSAVHHVWIEDHAVVEEITTTPILDDNGDVSYVIEEFRDVTKLLGLKKGIISICSYCRKIRDEDGHWVTFEVYLQKHTGADFSHGICEECNDSLFSDYKNSDSH